jgi:hypothetical protein
LKASIPLQKFSWKTGYSDDIGKQAPFSQWVSHVQTFYLAAARRALTFASAERQTASRVAGELSPRRISKHKRGQEP